MIIEVFDEGNDRIGSVCDKGAHWTAYTLDGNVIGQYVDQGAAEEAVHRGHYLEAVVKEVVNEIEALIGIED